MQETQNELPKAPEPAFKIAEKQENTRSRFALVFIWGYLLIIAGLIVLSTFFALPSELVKDFLLAIGSPLGFIVGYYFKSTDNV